MRNSVYVICLTILLGCSSQAEKINLDHLQGEWLNKNYVETLKSTMSPQKAVEKLGGVYPTSFIISKDRDGDFYWGVSWNFHEGGGGSGLRGLEPTSESNTYLLLFAEYPNEGNHRLVIADEKPIDEIVWVYNSKDKEHRVPFVRGRPTVEDYVNQLVLAGTYKDGQDRTFVFSDSGKGEWPDKSFKYKVELDFVFNYDCFKVVDERDENDYPVRFIFDWQEDHLLIFHAIYPEDEGEYLEREKEPLFVLTPHVNQ